MAKDNLNARIKVIFYLCLCMFAIHLVNIALNGMLTNYGIYPRETLGLRGILLAPFIHGSWYHLANNLVAMGIFSAITLLKGKRYFYRASLYIIVVTGILVWLFARPAMHIGASGWLFGLWSLAISSAIFQRNFANIVISIAVLFFYGGMIVGVLPQSHHISFESHLFGAIAGFSCAYVFAKRGIR